MPKLDTDFGRGATFRDQANNNCQCTIILAGGAHRKHVVTWRRKIFQLRGLAVTFQQSAKALFTANFTPRQMFRTRAKRVVELLSLTRGQRQREYYSCLRKRITGYSQKTS